MANIVYQAEKPKNARDLLDLFVSVGWGKPEQYDLGLLQASIEGMTSIYTAYDDSRLVGMARVLSDGHTVSWLVDIAVAPTHQKQGIGRTLVNMAMQEYGHTAFYTHGFDKNQQFLQSCGLFNKTGMLISFTKAPRAA